MLAISGLGRQRQVNLGWLASEPGVLKKVPGQWETLSQNCKMNSTLRMLLKGDRPLALTHINKYIHPHTWALMWMHMHTHTHTHTRHSNNVCTFSSLFDGTLIHWCLTEQFWLKGPMEMKWGFWPWQSIVLSMVGEFAFSKDSHALFLVQWLCL